MNADGRLAMSNWSSKRKSVQWRGGVATSVGVPPGPVVCLRERGVARELPEGASFKSSSASIESMKFLWFEKSDAWRLT